MRPLRIVWRARVYLTLSQLCLVAPALAAEPAAAPDQGAADYRDDARRLATAAAQRYEAGDYSVALDLFTRSAKLYDAPTLRFWQARCLEQLGRLVEAEAKYAEVVREELDGDVPEAFVKAQRDSATALADLRKRLPTITILVKNAKDISRVELDDRPLPAPLVGAPVAVDPGTHVVKVTRSSGGSQTESVAIVESQAQKVYVNFDKPNQAPLDPLTPTSETQASQPSSGQATMAWALLAAGTLGVGVGAVAGVKAMKKYHSLEDNCPTTQCAPAYHSDIDSFHTLTLISTIGYVVGVVGIGAGAVLLWTNNPETNRVTLRVGPTSASLRHTF